MATYAQPVVERRVTNRRLESVSIDHQSLLAPIGRALFAAIFVAGGFQHFSGTTIQYAAAQGLPMANILVPAAGALSIAGGLCILLGFHARLGAWLIVLFLVPVTFTMHAFWSVEDPAARAIQQAMFMKNLAMLGGAMLIAYWGAGAFSLDRRRLAAGGN